MNKKLAAGTAAAALAVCAAAVCFLANPDVLPDAPSDGPSGPASDISAPYLNSVQPVEAHTYVCGAVLYQSPVISSYFSDGGWMGTVRIEGNTLTMVSGEEAVSYTLSGTQSCKPEEFYALLPEEESELRSLFPEDAVSVTLRTYQTVYLWEVISASGGTYLWTGDPFVRLFALIDLDDALPFWANGALWTYDPAVSTILPIRFDFDAAVTVTSGALSQEISGEWSDALSVESGETIYWQPSTDGAPEIGAILQYRSDSGDLEDALELRPVMDYQGLYGSKTYGISNNWLGLASSAIHLSELNVDTDTGELAVRRYDQDGPYSFRGSGVPGKTTIRGTSTPSKVTDAHAVQ